MENRFVSKNHVWSGRSGVLLDRTAAGAAPNHSNQHAKSVEEGHFHSPKGDNSVLPKSKSTGLKSPFTAMDANPVLGVNLPAHMFMQAINFDSRQQRSDGQSDYQNDSEIDQELEDFPSSPKVEEPIHNGSLNVSEAQADLLEQQQAIEQAKLLQRFKELRAWQLQQQQLLMYQQQSQLMALKSEQSRVQDMITKQRQAQWGGKVVKAPSSDSSPFVSPRRRPAGIAQALAGGMAARYQHNHNMTERGDSHRGQVHSISQGPIQPKTGLPRPQLPDTDSEGGCNTNPELYSNPGSIDSHDSADLHPLPKVPSEDGDINFLRQQAHMREWTTREAIPGSSDDGEDEYMRLLASQHQEEKHTNGWSSVSRQLQPASQRQIIPQSQAEVKDGNSPSAMDKSALYARREVSQPTDSRLKNDGFEVETDEGFGTQSFHSSPLSARQANSDPVTANVVSEDSRTEEGDDTLQKQSEEALLGDGDLDERPVSSAVTGKKSFEQLLEEQLRAEEEKIQESPPTVTSSKTPKRPFLRRGQGLERFKAPPKKRETTNARNAHQPRKPESFTTSAPARKTVNIGKTSAKGPKTAPKHQNRLESAKVENEQRTVPAPKTGQGLPGLAQKSLKLRPLAKNSTTDAKKSVDTTSTSAAVSSKTATGVGLSEGKKETDGADKSNPKSSVISQHGVKETKSQQETGNVKDVDVSFLAHLEKIGQTDKVEAEDLEEFEMLEHFADNASFSSNSSLVVKVLQRDRLKAAQFNGVPVAAYQQSFTRADHMRFFNPIKFGSQDEETEQKDGHISPPHVNVNSDSDTSSSDSSDTESEDSDLMSTIKHQDLHSVVPERKDCETGVQTDLNGFPEDRTSNNKNFWNADHTDESQSDTETKTSNKNSSPFFQQSDVTKSPVKRKIAGRTNINPSASNFVNGASPPDIDDPSSASYKLHLISQKKREGGLSKDSDSFSSSCDEETEMSHPRNSQSNDRNSNNLKVRSSSSSKDSLEEKEDKDLYKDEFDDEEEWGETSVKQIRSNNSGGSDADDTLIEEKNSKEKADSDRAAEPFPSKASPPPTSKLITKLFPKLRPQKPPPKQQEQLDKLQQAREAPANNGVHSKLLREKLAELEAEINKFRAENANLDRLRREREEGLSKLKREISDFEKEKNEELQRLNEFKAQEIKKLKHEKKVFEKYQKAARSMPDKREREEIETLRSQLAELQDELKRKESRWSANTTRLKSRVEELEQENVELKEEIRLLEKKRLEALQREQANKVSGRVIQQAQPVVVPCISEIGVNGAHVLHTDSEEEINPVREDKKKRKPTGLTLKPGNRGRPDKTSPRANHKADRSGSTNHRPKSGKQKSDKINSPSKSSNQKPGNDPLNLTRASLTEDVPRRQFNAEATPQQDSVSLSGSSSGIQPSQSRKLAARFNVDKSSIDKGGDYEEVQHPDGKLERIYNTGAREILFSNGTRKEISSDGQSIIVSFFNGDIKQIMADHRVVYYYSEAQTTHSTFPDGLEILQFPNNQVEKHYPDGTKEITFPDQTIKYLFPSGLEESVFTDGTVIRVEKTGDKTIEFPNGQREIHTQQYKKREYPDGTVKTVFPDGRQETRYANGRVRVKDRDGNVVMDNKT